MIPWPTHLKVAAWIEFVAWVILCSALVGCAAQPVSYAEWRPRLRGMPAMTEEFNMAVVSQPPCYTVFDVTPEFPNVLQFGNDQKPIPGSGFVHDKTTYSPNIVVYVTCDANTNLFFTSQQ